MVTPKCYRGMWQRTELNPNCCRWGGKRVELGVPWLCSCLYLLFCEVHMSLCCGRCCVAYLASSAVLLLQQVPAHQELGRWAAVLKGLQQQGGNQEVDRLPEAHHACYAPKSKERLGTARSNSELYFKVGSLGLFLLLLLAFLDFVGFFFLTQVAAFFNVSLQSLGLETLVFISSLPGFFYN